MLFMKELCITRSVKAQSEVRKILQQNNIRYRVKIIDRSILKYRVASNPISDTIYEIYVKEKDLEDSKYLIKEVKLI